MVLSNKLRRSGVYLLVALQVCSFFVATTQAWQQLWPTSWRQKPSLHLSDHSGLPSNNSIGRRHLFQKSLSSAAALLVATSPANAAHTTAAVEETIAYTVDPFSFELPKSWKVIVNKTPGAKADFFLGAASSANDGKVFSALDFGTGAVLTVVHEQICTPAEYAASDDKQCDILAAANSAMPFSSPDILSKDVSKLLIRHDDRDNAVLQGTTVLESVEAVSNSNKNSQAWNVFATTNLPTGGTYRDTMGLDQPAMLARKVQTKVIKFDNDPNHIITLWYTVPIDDWNKPTTGLKLREIWKSISVLQ